MIAYIPCLNPDSSASNAAGSGIQVVSANSIAAGLVNLAGTAIPVTIGETVLWFNPYTALIAFAINYQFWLDLFGFGDTRIDREKQQIQDIYTGIFTYLHVAYDVPVRDGHALLFDSDGVRKQFDVRPDIAALMAPLLATSPVVTKDIFAHGSPTQGQIERTVNQFLANAAVNNWPAQATLDIWNGLVKAADPTCAQDHDRWLKNPAILRTAAIGAAILQYIPLNVLLDYATYHWVGDPLLENLIMLWANNPFLVQYVPQKTGLPWQQMYIDGTSNLPPWGSFITGVIPLLKRDHIIAVVNTVTIPLPQYPDFSVNLQGYVPNPQPPPVIPAPQPTPTPVPQPPSPTPVPQPTPPPQGQPPTPPDESGQPTLNIPPRKQDGTAYSQEELDYACNISRLAYGNAPYTESERAWAVDPLNAALLEYQLLNPQCQIPLTRQQPQDPAVPSPHQCPPHQPPGQTPSPLPPGQVDPIPPRQGEPSYPDPQHPCPPDCNYQIDVLRQQQKDCCDELHQHVIPRILDLETWVYDLERRVPGPKPQLPYPKEGPNDPTLFPDPPDVIPVPSPEPTPEPVPTHEPPTFCADVVECIATHCHQVNLILDACKEAAKQTDCEEGIAKWGKWAECWLNANTFNPPFAPVLLPNPVTVNYAVSSMVEIYQAEPGTVLGSRVKDGAERMRQILGGNLAVAGTTFGAGQPRPTFIYEEVA